MFNKFMNQKKTSAIEEISKILVAYTTTFLKNMFIRSNNINSLKLLYCILPYNQLLPSNILFPIIIYLSTYVLRDHFQERTHRESSSLQMYS